MGMTYVSNTLSLHALSAASIREHPVWAHVTTRLQKIPRHAALLHCHAVAIARVIMSER